MTTIVNFPKSKIVREIPPNIEELNKAKEKSLQNFADSLVDDLIAVILTELDNYGIETEDKEQNFDRDFSFSIDSLRATIYRTLHLDHHLHKFMNENVKVVRASSREEAMDIIESRMKEDAAQPE